MRIRLNANVSILKSHAGWFYFASLSLWVALDMGYRLYVTSVHGYEGFVYEPNWSKYAEGLGIYLLLLILSPKYLKRPSDLFQVVLLFGLMAPFLIIYGLANKAREYLYIVLMGYVLVDWMRRGSKIHFPMVRFGQWIALGGMALGAGLASIWIFISGGINYFNLDLAAVYEFRADVGSVIDQGLMTYINNWTYTVFGPTLLGVALWKRHFGLALIVIFAHVYWFGVSSHKAVLFYPFLVLFLWHWFQKARMISAVPFAITMVVLFSLLLYATTDFGITVSTLFIRRTFFVTAINTFSYYEYFSANENIYWSNSVLRCCLDYPYHLVPADLIGEWRGTGGYANNTFLATGFMHAGVWGIVGYSVFVGLMFRMIDSLAVQGLPLWLATSVLIVPSRALLLSADLPTSLLTHGIGVGVFILFLLRAIKPISQNTVRQNMLVSRVDRESFAYRKTT